MEYEENFNIYDFNRLIDSGFTDEYFHYGDNHDNYDDYVFSLDEEKALTNAGKNLFPNGETETWRIFEKNVYDKRIRIIKQPDERGWFLTKTYSLTENIEFTFKKYYEKMFEYEKEFREKNERDEREHEKELYEKEKTEKIIIKNNFDKFMKNPVYRKFFNLLKGYDYFFENDYDSYNETPETFLQSTFFDRGNADKSYDRLIEFSREKYNRKKEKYNFRIRNPSYYQNEKEKTEKIGKELDYFLAFLKPHVLDYDARRRGDFSNFNTTILKEEKKIVQKTETQINAEKLMKKVYEEKIENLEYKIRDAQSKYSMNKSKYNKLYFKLKNLDALEKKKSILEEKIKNRNLKIEERQNLLKQKTEIDQKLKNVDSLKNQLADLKSKIPSLSVYEQEKILRENELEKLKKLNETSIREKNANIRSLELEKMKQEIAIREEQRYQQEKRQAEELKKLKIVFLKEKKIVQKRIDQLKWESKSKKIKLKSILENESELRDQKQKLAEILSQKQSALKSKQAEIERKKIQTLEIEKQKLTDLAEQQKLFQDSIQLDIDDLNLQKQLLSETTNANKKILSNSKKEISQRQTEIEKTISLNMENAKKSANEIYAKEAKIKLDVFQTLSDVKEQAAIQSELEIELENKKQEILRKEAVSSLLSDTIDKISFNEISEIENYNSFLESEIDFKKKLSDTHLTQKQVLEILTDEKKSYIQFLEETKSSYLTQMLNAKRDILEKNMKIILIEGKENLSYVTAGMKSEIENLEKKKEINQRKKDLAQFQSDNLKRELNLRNQEIELLKNIRLKVLQTERRVLRNEARQAFLDFAKAEEKKTRDADVREKLDEIIDDVESKDISQKTKSTLFSLIDKIENQEIHDAAKQKLDFILDKIELHDNVDESRKALDKILDSIENQQIQKEVETKLDEILDDVEYDDIDFLDEEDELESFLSSVRKHISGEQKMDRFSTILQETREMDSKLKMEENIEMREQGERPPEQDEIGETSFDEFSDYNFFINNIEDPILKSKTRQFLGNIDAFEKEEEKIPKIKNAYKSAVNDALWNDKLDLDYWKGNIIQDEQAKFKYEQKINNLNTALVDYDLHIDPLDMKVRNFLDIKLTETFSEKRGEINGYSYNGEKIISRNISRNYYFNYSKKPAACQSFIEALKDKINNTARSQIANESFFEGKSVENCALEYIGELREEQSYQIDSARNASEMRSALRDVNEIDSEIKNIKKNSSFKMRIKIFRRTLSWRFTKLLRFLWKHKGKTAAGIFTIIATGIGILLNQLSVIAIVHNLKKGMTSVKQYADDVHAMGSRIIRTVQSFYKVPGTLVGYGLIVLAIFLRIIYFFTRMSGTYLSAAVFGALGVTFEALIYFEGSAEKMNEKVADAMEETGNILENAGIRAQKYIIKNSPKWYWDIPTNKKTILQVVESGATKMIYKIAQGTQTAGKKVEEASETVRSSIWYLKIFLIVMIVSMSLLFLRNNFF